MLTVLTILEAKNILGKKNGNEIARLDMKNGKINQSQIYSNTTKRHDTTRNDTKRDETKQDKTNQKRE